MQWNNLTPNKGIKETNMSKEENYKLATFAGGCFWCMIPPFQSLNGVISVTAGYTGGFVPNPSYKEVCSGKTGHYEAVQVVYDPSRISFEELTDVFWRQINPVDPSGQFHDRGPQYETAIFYHDEEQKRIAIESEEKLDASGKFKGTIQTKILEANEFYSAEEYHQDYHLKNPEHYSAYKKGSGREDYIKEAWGNCNGKSDIPENKNFTLPSDEVLKKRLTPMQYNVTRKNATEPPFENEFYDNKKEGIYVDIISGEPLFSSLDKFDSGCGWPSFAKPLEKNKILEKLDLSHSMVRTEVRGKTSDSHLGHVFTDGPLPSGLRYCINSSALRFIPLDNLGKEGYGEYLKLFS